MYPAALTATTWRIECYAGRSKGMWKSSARRPGMCPLPFRGLIPRSPGSEPHRPAERGGARVRRDQAGADRACGHRASPGAHRPAGAAGPAAPGPGQPLRRRFQIFERPAPYPFSLPRCFTFRPPSFTRPAPMLLGFPAPLCPLSPCRSFKGRAGGV